MMTRTPLVITRPWFFTILSVIANSYLAIPEQGNEPLLLALRTTWAKELSLDKNVSVYNDLTDALRLALRAYNIR